MKRVGLYAAQSRRQELARCLGGCAVDYRDCRLAPLDAALPGWEVAGMDCVVIDDLSCEAREAMEETLLAWARRATPTSPRIIFVSDPSREIDDPFFFQLVSIADVKDIVYEPVCRPLEEEVALRIESPARLLEVSWWKTDDKDKVTRPKERKGPAGAIARWKADRERARMSRQALEEGKERRLRAEEAQRQRKEQQASAAAARRAAGGPCCPKCGTLHPEGARFCQACGCPIGGAEAAKDAPPAAQAQPAPAREQGRPAAAGSAGEKEEDGMETEDKEFRMYCPDAPAVVAVAGSVRGAGCTHLACALAVELAAKGAACAMCFRSTDEFELARAVLAPGAQGPFRALGVDFYPYDAQREQAGRYDVCVVDCGLVDYPDRDPNSPALLFSRAPFKALVLSGAPWRVQPSLECAARLGRKTLAGASLFAYSASREVAKAFGEAIGAKLGTAAPQVTQLPYRGAMFVDRSSRYDSYKGLLDRVLKGVPNKKSPSDGASEQAFK